MLYTLISWLWIGISCFLIGYFVLDLLSRWTKTAVPDIDLIMMFGLCFLTVFAQCFSLFYQVGVLANGVLLLFNIVILLVERKSLKKQMVEWCSKKYPVNKHIIYTVVVIIVLVVMVLSSSSIHHYDTNLYHAQSIRWIEEFGVVKGLGNLHNRLAYNSALFSLQALFSMKFLFGQSLHSVNGFVICFFLVYAFMSMRIFREKRVYISDFFRISMILFCNLESTYDMISSPGSDLLAIGLFIYLLTKVVSLIEDECREIGPYAYLCVLGVFAVTVKLSVAMIVLFTVIPVCYIVKEKKWKDLGIYLVTGLVVALPFLARNVIISGYLVYPYPEIDLFHVDWKMPAYTLLFDRNEIKAWGMELRDVALYDTPLRDWLPIWYDSMTQMGRALVLCNIGLLALSVLWALWQLRKKRYEELCVLVVIVANLALWFLGAPLPRYGMPFMLLLPLGAIGIIVKKVSRQPNNAVVVGLLLCCILASYPSTQYACQRVLDNKISMLAPKDYKEIECSPFALEDETVYGPQEWDLTGYHYFPSTPYIGRLELIELRGESFKEGFRMKEQYRNAYVSTYGQVYDENMFK